MTIPLLVSTDWLAAHLDNPNVRVADVRWYLLDKDKTGRGEYLNGHIPGAVFFDVDTDLAAPPLQGPGRHPLPSAERFAQAAARAGITPNVHLVAYDDRGGASAARLWWLLRYFGHDAVSLLDGGITQWIAEGRPLQTGTPGITRTTFVPRPRPEMFVDKARVHALRGDPATLILDVRVAERYAGLVEPLDPQAGHIPGAKNAPLAGNLRGTHDLRFRTPEELRARFEQLGTRDAARLVVYCGSGINACQTIFALALAGFDNALLYVGSWSDWSRDPSLPIETGE